MRNPSAPIDYSLRAEEIAAQRTAIKGRIIALTALLPLIAFLSPWPAPLFPYILIALLMLSGIASLWLQQMSWYRPVFQYAFVTVDCAIVCMALIYPNPFQPNDMPPQFMLRYGTFIFFFLVLAELTYQYRPRLVIWGGVSIALCWGVGVWLLLRLPNTVWTEPDQMDLPAVFAQQANPYFINVDIRIQEIFATLVVAGLLALAVRRSRAAVVRQARFAKERANLARYFPRKTAALLAQRANPFSAPREHQCAVVFADLVGFTEWSERHTPSEVITLLRAVQGQLAGIVFRHGGTLDKFLGDGLMATFGTPDPGPQDAANALTAAQEMSDAFQDWSDDPDNTLAEGLRLSIGAHYGPVVIGNVGSDERLEFAVLGDTVNVASRLEAATRPQGCACVFSNALVKAAQDQAGSEIGGVLARLQPPVMLEVRGRSEPLEVHELPRNPDGQQRMIPGQRTIPDGSDKNASGNGPGSA